jgi:DNA-binding response OmpR family regulator
MRLLVVDDDKNLLVAARRLLEQQGHVVDAFGDVERALAAFVANAEAYDGAILDVNIGFDDGVELAMKLRARRASLHVAFATGSDDSAARAAPHGPVLRKPYTPAELAAIIASWQRGA